MMSDNPAFQMKVFSDKQAAEAWLEIQPNEKFVTGYERLSASLA